MTVESRSPEPAPVDDFDDVLERRIANGIIDYRGTENLDDLASRAGAAGWQLIHLDGSDVTTKAHYLQMWCDAANFPDTFGHNWDALADALTDLSWLHASGYVVVAENLSETADWAALGRELMVEACDAWADNGTPFLVLRR